MPRINAIDRRVLDAMGGEDRIRLLLKDAGYDTLRSFAKEHGVYLEEVSMCLRRRREYPEVRDAMAEVLRLTREQIDELIPWPASAEEDAA